MDVNTLSQFYFVYDDTDSDRQELFESVKAIEDIVKTDIEGAANSIRNFLEKLVNIVIAKDYPGDSDFINTDGTEKSLDAKIKILYDSKSHPLFKDILSTRPNKHFKVNEDYLNEAGNTFSLRQDGSHNDNRYTDRFTYLRLLGNNGHHEGANPYWPKLSYENCILGLKIIYKILRQYTGYTGTEQFNEKKLPIARYYIEKYTNMQDAAITGCSCEYIAFKLGKVKKYAVIREYKKEDNDDLFLYRNDHVYETIKYETDDETVKGISSTRDIIKNNSPFFYVINEVGGSKPETLRSRIKTLSLKERLEICISIGQCLDALHKLDNPIYNRLLSYKNIYVREGKKGIIAYILKFDFAKIVDAQGTVVANLANKSVLQEISDIKKYMAPEFDAAINLGKDPTTATTVDWAAIDRYSYGILCRDIIKGEFTSLGVNVKALNGISADVKDMLSKLSGVPGVRPVLSEVIEVLKKEVEAH